MSLFWAEMRKVWGGRLAPLLAAVLAAANLLLLWLGTRPAADRPAPAAYRAAGRELTGLTMAEKGAFLQQKLAEATALCNLQAYYRDAAWGSTWAQAWRAQNADTLARYGALYRERAYTLYTGSLETERRFWAELVQEYDTVNAYGDFLRGVQQNAAQLTAVSVFRRSGDDYARKNIEDIAAVYAGLGAVAIDYWPQKGLMTALESPFTDLLALAAMLLLALGLVRQERDAGVLGLVRSTPGGRLKTALAKLAAFAASLLAVLALLYGVNLLWCGAMYGMGPLSRSVQSVPALMRSTLQITVGRYLARFLLAKWAGAAVTGLWVMLAALAARRAWGGSLAALALPLAMYGVRAAIPATARLNVLRYANLASLLHTDELLGTYRNLYWFGSPVPLPAVAWCAAAVYGAVLGGGFCLLFARGRLAAAPPRAPAGRARRTRPATVWGAEARKLLLTGGAGLCLAAFLGLGAWQGAHTRTWRGPAETFYAECLARVTGPWSAQSRDRLAAMGQKFLPLARTRRRVAAGLQPQEALYAYGTLELEYDAYQKVRDHIAAYLPQHPAAWLLYDGGYRALLGLDTGGDAQDALLAGLLCAVCFASLFAQERRAGAEALLLTTPLGRGRTARAKLGCAAAVAVGIALGTCLPRVLVAVRDYGLPAPFAPACSMEAFAALPPAVTLSDVLLLWVLCRAAACLCMGAFTLWLGRRLGGALPAICLGTVLYCLPPLLAMAGMQGGIEWLGGYGLFHAAALLTVQGYGAAGQPYTLAWAVFVLLAAALLITAALAQSLYTAYAWAGRG